MPSEKARENKKMEALERLRSSITDLRAKVRKDLSSKDERTKCQALVVAVIDEVYERVGNKESEKERGHYGVTGWKKEHITSKGREIHVQYVGKSGVKQNKVIKDEVIVKELKKMLEGKDKDQFIFDYECEGSRTRVSPTLINEYLEPFKITAKDIRGYHANDLMKKALKDLTSQKDIDPKDKEKHFKKIFDKALSDVAAAIGHEPETLRNQYLVPHLEKTFMKDGKVIESLNKKMSSLSPQNVVNAYLRSLMDKEE